MLSEIRHITPEEAGISSSCIERFLDVIEQNRIRLHSFIVMRNSKICAEGYWKPFAAETPHRMYSITKSFVGMAIGVLADEGKISLSDKIIKFFPELVPDDVHPYIADATVENLLTMSTMYSKPTYTYGKDNWLESYFTSTPDHPAGTLFDYDSCGSYVLGAIVRKVTGKYFEEYLKEKVLLKLGFSKDRRCLLGPDGESWAGSGLIITPRELAVFADFLLNGGKYKGEQLISEKFVKDATSARVFNRNDGSDYSYNCGYGYQIWILKDNAFFLNGMGGQMAIAFPDTGLVFVCTADVQGNPCGKHVVFDALWNEIVANLGSSLPEDKCAYEKLKYRCENLSFAPLQGEMHSKSEKDISGKTYVLGDNPMKISDVCFIFSDDCGIMEYSTPRGKKKLDFSLGKFREYLFPETHYSGEKLGESINREFKCLNSGAWVNDNTLVITSYIIDEYIGNLTITVGFKEKEIGITMRKNAQFFLDEYNGFAGGVIKQ